MSLADFFPEEYRDGFAQRNIQVGSVIRAFVADTNPPKEKRFIIMGFAYDRLTIASVYVNTEINENIFPTPELQALHIPLSCVNRDYLTHDSFVDCSQLKVRDCNWLYTIINAEPERIIGCLTDADYKQLRDVIKNSDTIGIAQKKRFGLFL